MAIASASAAGIMPCLCQGDLGGNNAGKTVLFAPDGPHLRSAVPFLNGVDCHENRSVVVGYSV